MDNCIFCKIANGVIPAKKYYEDDDMVIIADINPQAEKHYLLIPKAHFANIIEMTDDQAIMLGKCIKKHRPPMEGGVRNNWGNYQDSMLWNRSI